MNVAKLTLRMIRIRIFFKLVARFPLETLQQLILENETDDDASKCQAYLSNEASAGEASQFLLFFSASKQAERITSDRVRPSAASFNYREVY